MKTIMPVVALLSIMVGCAGSRTISTGTLRNAKYTIASPAKWNGDMLVIAPGYKPVDAPLSAAIDTQAPLYRRLLDEGWVVAATSYRRNGTVIRDGSEDIKLLRQHVAQQFGSPSRTFVVGWSMGGAVATIIAETGGSDYHGILAIGAALQMRDATNPYQMTYRPQVPILFLTNQNELKNSSEYVSKADASAKPVALWVVGRDGHCNINGREIGLALDALVRCSQTGELERNKKITIANLRQPSVAVFKNGRAYGTVTRISHGFGNVNTSFVQADMERLGISLGSRFVLGIRNKNFSVFFGKQFSDVPHGEWIGFVTANDNLLIARNMANAAKKLACKKGEEIYIAPPP